MAVSTGYVVRETGVNLKRNFLMTFAAILTVAVSLFLVACALLMRQATNKAAVQWKGGVELSIFLQPTVTDSQRDTIGHELQTMSDIKRVRYVDKPQAYAEFKQMFANTPDLVGSLAVSDMPPSYRVVPTRAEDVTAIGNRFTNQPGVKEVVYAKEVINSLLKDYHTKTRVAVFIAAGVFLGAIALIVITIQLAIFARRREVAVMKLVGATNWFIRLPFMLEGLIEGVLGAIVAFGLSYLFRDTIASFVSNNALAGGTPLFVTANEAIYTGLLILAVGAGVGAIGSALGVSGFLSV